MYNSRCVATQEARAAKITQSCDTGIDITLLERLLEGQDASSSLTPQLGFDSLCFETSEDLMREK